MTLTRRFSLQFAAVAGAGVALTVALIFAVFLVRMDALGGEMRQMFSDSIEGELRRDAEKALAILSEAAHGPLLDYDRETLDRLARSVGGAAPGARIRIFDHHGRMLADTANGVMGLPETKPQALKGLTEAEGVRRWRQADALFAGQAVCMREICLGVIEVAVNGSAATDASSRVDARLGEAELDFLTQALLLLLVLLLLIALGAAGIGWVLGRRLDDSIKSAVRAMEEIRDGARAVSIDVRDTQLGELREALASLAEKLADERERHDQIAEHIEDGLFVAKPGGRIVMANPALHALLRKPNYALFGADAYGLLGLPPAEDAAGFAAAACTVSQLSLDDGETLPVLVSAQVAGEPPAEKVVGIIRDGSALAEAQAAAEAAQLRAEAAERARDEFLAVMSHELRTPLNGVLGGAAVLAGTELSNAQKKFVGIVQESGKSMLRMVGSMLDFARLKSGDVTLDAVSTDTDGLSHAVADAIAGAAGQKGLRVILNVQPGAPVVLTDGDKLRQAIDALTDNAVKFTNNGTVEISLTHRIEGDMAALRFSVADTGPGIDPAQRAAIFEGFSQVDSSSRRAAGGAGLGLALAGRLVDAMGGRVTLDSAPGRGATFAIEVSAPLDPAAAPRGESLAGAKALVVAGTQAEREALAGQLSHVGVDVAMAATGAEAVRAMSGDLRPNLVLHSDDLPDLESSGLRRLLEGEAGAQSVASVFLGAEDRALSNAPLHALAAPRNPTAGALLDAAERAMAAARAAGMALFGERTLAPEGPPATKDAPVLLLADDNEISRNLVSGFLTKSGYAVVPARTGFEAVKAFREARPRIVLIATELPVMSGIEAARAMRRFEKDKGLDEAPIIGMVGADQSGVRERGAGAGISDFLSKPVSTDEIGAKLERWTLLYGHAEAPSALEG